MAKRSRFGFSSSGRRSLFFRLRFIGHSQYLSLRGPLRNVKDWCGPPGLSAPGVNIHVHNILSIDKKKSRSNLRDTAGSLDWEEVGRRIRELRGFYITQAEFARRIGVSQGHLSHIEHGETEMGAEVLLKISREFGKSIEWLLTREDQK